MTWFTQKDICILVLICLFRVSLSPRLQTLRILDFFEGTLGLMDNFKNDPQAKKLWDGAPRAWPARIMANPTCHVSAVSQQKSTV